MENQKIEIEIKVLLWEQKNADSLVEKMSKFDPNLSLNEESKQLNHYFLRDWNFEKLFENISKIISSWKIDYLNHILFEWKEHSIRTRIANDQVIFIVKAVADDTNAENGIARVEFEEKISWISLEDLDKKILDCWFTYQSKWSRHRKEYKYKDFNVCLDRNAWYWWLCEVEKIIEDKAQIDSAKKTIYDELIILWLEELKQDRLDRMFKFYNSNWRDYYWTDKTFIIE